MPKLFPRAKKRLDPDLFERVEDKEVFQRAKLMYLSGRRGVLRTPPEFFDEAAEVWEELGRPELRLAGPKLNILWFPFQDDFFRFAGELAGRGWYMLSPGGAASMYFGVTREAVHNFFWRYGNLVGLYSEEDGRGEAVFMLAVLDRR